MSKSMILYKIQNKINNKMYVGITNNIKRRWKEHRVELNGNRHGNKHFQFAWNKYGIDNFNFEIISKFNTLEDLNKAEIEYIKEFDLKNPKNGYSIADGGNSFLHSQKAKNAISKSQEVAIIRKCLKTGEEKMYNRIKDVELDGFNHKQIGSACKDRALTYKKNIWMYLKDYKINPEKLQEKFKTRQNTKARPSRYRKVYGMNIKTKEIVKYEAVCHTKKDGFNSTVVDKCCRIPNINKSHKGFVWSFDRDNLKHLTNRASAGNTNRKKIYKFTKNKTLIGEIDRELFTRNKLRGIHNVCTGKRKTYKGFIYKYEGGISGC